MNVDYRHRKYPNRLKVIRNNMGYSQRQIANVLGIKRKALISDWENEKAMPNGIHLVKLCILYNKSMQELYPEYFQQIAQRIMGL